MNVSSVVLALFDKLYRLASARVLHNTLDNGSFGDCNCCSRHGSGDFRGVGNFNFASGDDVAFYVACDNDVARPDSAGPTTISGERDRTTQVTLAVDFAIDQNVASSCNQTRYLAAFADKCGLAGSMVAHPASLCTIHTSNAPEVDCGCQNA